MEKKALTYAMMFAKAYYKNEQEIETEQQHDSEEQGG